MNTAKKTALCLAYKDALETNKGIIAIADIPRDCARFSEKVQEGNVEDLDRRIRSRLHPYAQPVLDVLYS